jgi:hypothetical protein
VSALKVWPNAEDLAAHEEERVRIEAADAGVTPDADADAGAGAARTFAPLTFAKTPYKRWFLQKSSVELAVWRTAAAERSLPLAESVGVLLAFMHEMLDRDGDGDVDVHDLKHH